MTRITTIVSDLDELLDIRAFADLGPNGLQVPAPDDLDVKRVVTGVSAQRSLL